MIKSGESGEGWSCKEGCCGGVGVGGCGRGLEAGRGGGQVSAEEREGERKVGAGIG